MQSYCGILWHQSILDFNIFVHLFRILYKCQRWQWVWGMGLIFTIFSGRPGDTAATGPWTTSGIAKIWYLLFLPHPSFLAVLASGGGKSLQSSDS